MKVRQGLSESQVLVVALRLAPYICAHATPDLVAIYHMAWRRHTPHQLNDSIFIPSIQHKPHVPHVPQDFKYTWLNGRMLEDEK